MFHYKQIGISGLFVKPKDHFSGVVLSELFYQLGIINAAQHYAYETMIGYSNIKELNIRNLKRLCDCAALRNDSALIAKYEMIMNQTLFYRNHKSQNVPKAVGMQNTLSGDIPVLLTSILEENRDNQAIFEYLMAYYLLERDYNQAKNCYDRYFSNFSYSRIPTHYAEFLTLYKHINHLDNRFYEQYPVPSEICERFNEANQLLSSQMNSRIKKTLENNFKDTYWFYVKFSSVQTQKK